MGFFSKDEINPKLIPFIQKHEAVGIVKVNDIGKYSVRLESDRIILESYEPNQQLKPIALRDISYLEYYKGNFINEPKLTLEANRRTYVFAGVDDNDDELNAFYHTILQIKQNEQNERQKISSRGMPHPNLNVTNPNKQVPKKEFSQNKDLNDEYIENNKVNVSGDVKSSDVPKSEGVSKNVDFEDEYVDNPPVNNSQDMSNQVQSMENNPEIILDPADQIRKFYELKEDGIITQEEFDKKKKQLLNL